MQILFAGGLVFDGENPPVAGQGVMIENGRIAAMRPAGEFAGFAGRKIDTTGLTLMPGLIDCHVHLTVGAEPQAVAVLGQLSTAEIAVRALENAQATLRGGTTAVRDIGDKEYISLTVRDAIDASRHLGPTVRCAGRVICITGGHGWWGGGREVDGPDETVKGVRENIKAGADFIKFIATGGVMTPRADPMLAQLSAEEIAAGVRAANALGRRTAAHAQSPIGIGNAVRAGIASVEHGFVLTDELIAEMIAKRIYLVPTLACIAAFLGHADLGIPAFMVEKARRFHDLHRKSVRDFYRAGGLIAMGTDAGAPMCLHGENSQELEWMVEIGMSPIDALRAATSRAADLAEFAERGRVRAGYWADLLIVRGNPVEDIAAAADRKRHVHVFKNGFDALAALGKPRPGAAFPRFSPDAPAF